MAQDVEDEGLSGFGMVCRRCSNLNQYLTDSQRYVEVIQKIDGSGSYMAKYEIVDWSVRSQTVVVVVVVVAV